MTNPVAIEFAAEGVAAKINYSIPMPGAHTGRRIIEIDLSLDMPDPFSPDAMTAGEELDKALGVTKTDGQLHINADDARAFFSKELSKVGAQIDTEIESMDVSSVDNIGYSVSPETADASLRSGMGVPRRSTPMMISMPEFEAGMATFLENLGNSIVTIPVRDWAGKLFYISRPLYPIVQPRFFIVERYGISSFLGDYGMGRTVKTFTLLPGESITISLKTWQTTKESMQEASSIIDSHEQKARERFADKIQNETTDKATKSKTEKWHVEATASASWGFGSAKVSGGGSGEYHSGREQFARNASEAVSEHAAEASSKRELSVSSSSEKTFESGSESLIERTITNVNKRRVLNFVFRELNQTYVTKLHLKDIRIGFTNGLLNSWREVPLSGLRTLLTETLKPAYVDSAAQQILRVAGTVFDVDDNPVSVLEKVTIANNGDDIDVDDALRDGDGNFASPTDDIYYRFKAGPINQHNAEKPVDGVLLRESNITMRTDSVVVEALLGQADALDAFAMEIQEAAAAKDTLANDREKLILDTLAEIHDPVQRAELGAKLLGTCCSDQTE